jgi:hypothetical protein
MGAKFKSKTHTYTFFYFWCLLASKFAKVLIWPKKLLEKIKKKVSKNAEFHADFKSVENF